MRTRKRKSTKTNYNIFAFTIIFLFSVILILPTLTLLLTSGYRNSKSNSSSSQNNKTNLQYNTKSNKNSTKSNKNDDKTNNKVQNTKLKDSDKSDDSTIPTFKRTENSNLVFKKNIKVYLTYKKKVLSLPIEEYIKGVVSAEMPASFELDALKAQAIAARTYAYMCLNKNQDGCPYYKNADITDDYHQYQAFLTKDESLKLWSKSSANKYWSKISQAVDSTKGEVLFYNSNIIYAAFHSNSGGKTEDGYALTHEKYPYLKSVLSPGEENDPDYKSTFSISKDKFNITLKNLDTNYKSIPSKNALKYIEIISKTPGERVDKIKINNCTFRGPQIRSAFKLKSANFKISEQGDNLIFAVKGFGHGMGMSQYGANVMAKNGFNFVEILKHYYQGVKLERVY
jgi:stage II sporulation protein D